MLSDFSFSTTDLSLISRASYIFVMASRPDLSTGEGRFKDLKVRPPVPAYLPTAGSPLTVDAELYSAIQQAPRKLTQDFTLPIRSGRAWSAPAGSIVKISTPEGPQVGEFTAHPLEVGKRG